MIKNIVRCHRCSDTSAECELEFGHFNCSRQWPPVAADECGTLILSKMTITAELSWLDYVVIAGSLIISMGIGIYYRLTSGKQKTMQEYFSANRSMNATSVGIALMVSFISAITLLGVSAENYAFGSRFFIINFAYLLGTPLVCYGYLPVFYKLQVTSVYEYLEKRFGRETRVLASFILCIQILLYSGVVLYAPALALEATTKLSQMSSILSVGLACTFYSSIGGIKAVLITDIFQAGLMFASLIIIIITAAYSDGGLEQVWNIAKDNGRLNIYNFSFDPTERHTWWNLTIGGLCTCLSLYGVNQVQIQRLLAVKSLKSARNALWISWPILTLLSFMTCFSGLVIYSKYRECDPIETKRITSKEMLMPLYIMETMSSIPGLPGLFIAGIFSASLSTISAALNSLSIVTLEDYIKPLYTFFTRKEIGESSSLIVGKILAFAFGIACIAIAILAQYMGSILQTSLTIFGAVGGPLLGLFTLGMICQSATKFGAMAGTIISLMFTLWISFGGLNVKPHKLPTSIAGCNTTSVQLNSTTESLIPDSEYFYLYRISYLWYAPLGCLFTILIGWVVSKILQLTQSKKQLEIHPDLFFPFIATRIAKRKRKINKEVSRNAINDNYMSNNDKVHAITSI